MTSQLGRLLRYDIWANRATLDSLRSGPTARSIRWMGHIIGAEYLWLARLRGETSPLPVWPDLAVEACSDYLDELALLWADYLQGAKLSRLSQQVEYINTKGESWASTVEEILTHVVIHSAYHRGQIAADVRAAGQVPAYTDFIHAARQRLIP